MINIRISKSTDQSAIPFRLDRSLDASEELQHVDVLLEKAAREVLRHAGTTPDVEVTLVLTGDAQLRKLNHDFLGVDSPTDVLAFPGGETDPDTGSLYLGDVVISYQRARVQAGAAKHTLGEELQLLVVHGLLHLLGYDHVDEESKTAMWEMQNDILLRINSMGGVLEADRPDYSMEENESFH
jgi:probable rRNA maturation factor